MPAAYSRDLRERLLRAIDAGHSVAEIQRPTRVRARTLRRYRARLRQGDSLAPKPIPGPHHRLTPEQDALLVAQVDADPDATLAEHRATLAREHGLTISRATLEIWFDRAVFRCRDPVIEDPATEAELRVVAGTVLASVVQMREYHPD